MSSRPDRQRGAAGRGKTRPAARPGAPRADRSGDPDAPVGPPAYRAPALERGLDALELLAASGAAMTQAEIARALGRSPSELFRVLTVLERRAYLVREAVSGAYRPTLRLFELAQSHRPEEALLRAAAAPMRALTDATGEGCHLSILHRGALLVLAQEEGPARVRVSVAVGSTIAPWRAASGRVLLAGLPPAERVAALDAGPGGDVPVGADRAAVLDRLAVVAARGWEEAREETVAGVSDLSVPVGGGAVRAALAVAALPRDHGAWVTATLPRLREAAAAIERAAGLPRSAANADGARSTDGPGHEWPGS
jgi:DNA-binding IclR family transcriptional regulator